MFKETTAEDVLKVMRNDSKKLDDALNELKELKADLHKANEMIHGALIRYRKEKLKKSLLVHDITIPMIAEAAGVSESTVYRWLAHPEQMKIGTVDLIKDLAQMDKAEFNSIYPEIVA